MIKSLGIHIDTVFFIKIKLEILTFPKSITIYRKREGTPFVCLYFSIAQANRSAASILRQ
jgi:hypothetical protein